MVNAQTDMTTIQKWTIIENEMRTILFQTNEDMYNDGFNHTFIQLLMSV